MAGTFKFYVSKGSTHKFNEADMSKSSFISPKKKLPPIKLDQKTNALFAEQLEHTKEKEAAQREREEAKRKEEHEK